MRLKELREVLKQEEKINIIGHDNIDVDAFLSGVLLSNLLSFLGVQNEFIILEKIKKNDSYQIVKELFGIDMNEFYAEGEDVSRKLLLEDHYETKHLGEVVACIDHHPNKGGKTYPFIYSRIACSTSYMVYELMQEAEYEMTASEARMIIASMMIDTVSFRSGKTVPEEVIEAKKIAKQYDIDYDQLEKYSLCLTPIDTYSIKEIINNGYKYYNYNGNKVKSSYIQVYGMPRQESISEWIEEIRREVNAESLKMWVFIIFECENNHTFEYHVTKYDTDCIESNGILSRGTNIMPKIEKLFL